MSKFLLLTTTLFALLFIFCYINNTTEYFYTVTVNSGSHGTVCNAGDYQCRPQDALVLRVCSVEDGYKFKEWKLDSIKSASNCLISDRFNDTATISQIRGRVIVYPEFTQNVYTLNIASDTLGYVTATQIRNIVSGVKMRISSVAFPKDTIGYRFSHWIITTGSGEISGDSILMESDCSIKPVFKRNMCLLTVTEPSHGRVLDSSGGVMSGSYSFPFGYVVKLKVVADSGYQFSSWTGTTGSASTTVTINENKVVGTSIIEIPAVTGITYVWKGAPGKNNGTSWINAYNDLETALNNTPAGSEIWVAGGTYVPSNSSTPFQPKANMKICGGFNCYEENINQRNFRSNFSVLSGPSDFLLNLDNISGVRINGFVFKDASYYGVYANKATNDTIEDCVFKNINYSAVWLEGACLSNVFRRLVFHSNTNSDNNVNYGKCINITSTSRSTLIENSIFVDNEGPAIQDLTNSRENTDYTTITNCTIAYNVNKGTPPGGLKSTGNTRLNGCIIYFNDNSLHNSGMQVDSSWYVEDCDIQDALTTIGILRRSTSATLWRPDSNYSVDPNFPAYNYGGLLPNDQGWFSTGMNLPFMPNTMILLNKANFTFKPNCDLRNNEVTIGRGTNFDAGAYEVKP